LGRTRPLTNSRRDFHPPAAILAEVEAALAMYGPGEIDYITFAGQGEPLLCASLGQLIRDIKRISPIPVAVITNGSLLFEAEVRHELTAADVVLPSLNAADPETFQRINRPWPLLNVAAIIDGLVAFRENYAGQIWLEVMLVKGLNDTEPVLTTLARAIRRIRPDQIHLNLPIRPPAEAWVAPPDEAGLQRALAILGGAARVIQPTEMELLLGHHNSSLPTVIEILRRHPLSEAKIVEALRHQAASPQQIEQTLTTLASDRRARRLIYEDQVFWEYLGD
jgi:wyosine [tRNA(Phe)-imidazoG37] synthetase (radical SAM superfamily)